MEITTKYSVHIKFDIVSPSQRDRVTYDEFRLQLIKSPSGAA